MFLMRINIKPEMEKSGSQITALKAGKNLKGQRSNVYLNGKFAFSLDNEVIAREKLRVGSQVSPDEIKKLAGADRSQLCLNAAFKFLSYRPRSEAETRERLKYKGYDSREIEKAISELKRLQLINDGSFAEFWKENRTSFRPRSQRMVGLELRRKGVEPGIIQQAVSQIDDSESAYKVATTRARTLKAADFQVFRQKMGSYLQRRGFNYGVINKTVRQVWQEQTHESVPQSDSTPEDESPDRD
jgi:regulatory protein